MASGKAEQAVDQQANGIGQLTLVEHALCPVDTRTGLIENLVFHASYPYKSTDGRWRRAKARVICPAGLSAHDEFYLWGLLALTLEQSDSNAELLATPRYCLRQLGLIGDGTRVGGRQYQDFRSVIERLSLVSYQNNHFYDPIRTEHRRVGFGLLSYSMPHELESSRVWRIHWDVLFFELARATGGHCRFDLITYRSLDVASRRLFLLVTKIFRRRETTPEFDLADMATNVLGYARSLRPVDQKAKVDRCVARLSEVGVVRPVNKKTLFEKKQKGQYAFRLTRGPYFDQGRQNGQLSGLCDSPLHDPLHQIGLDDMAIGRLIKKYPTRLLQEWADITLAARERFGESFFNRSPMAYLVHNVQEAAKGTRTLPDWWSNMRKEELQQEAARHRWRRKQAYQTDYPQRAGDVFAHLMNEVFANRA